MARVTGSLAIYPARTAFAWYTGLILIGAFALSLPVCQNDREAKISHLDALFTSTSASCVTGLIVRSTPNDYSLAGQAVILALIQLGGIGILTVTTTIMLRFGGAETMRQRTVIEQTLGAGTDYDVRRMLRNVIRFVLVFESIGFVCLAVHHLLLPGGRRWQQCLWEALFHSISAFCNAGFALHDDSLTSYQDSIWVNGVIMSLIITGGIGFPVIVDIRRRWKMPWREMWTALTLHTKIMLIGTAMMLSLGTILILVLEWENALAGMSWDRRLLIAMFQSTTTRTAGFNTIDLALFTDETLFLMMIAMVIGAGPCSTAGGFKVSTLMVLLAHARSRLLGQQRVRIFRRSLPTETIDRAVATAFLFGVVAVIATVGFLIFEPHSKGRLLDSMFEVCSALGTVGLSINFTPTLNAASKWILILLMFLGRLGPITAFIALSVSGRKELIKYPNEEVLVG